MARRRAKKVSLSKAQQLENGVVKWTAKRDEKIKMLLHAVGKLLAAKRAQDRFVKREAAKPVKVKTKRVRKPKIVEVIEQVGDRLLATELRGQRMEAMGFRKVTKGKVAAALKTF